MNEIARRYAYETFAILVGNRGKRGYPLTVTQAPTGNVRAFSRLDPTARSLQGMLEMVESGQADEALLRRLGDLLFHALFTGDIASGYHSSLSMARGQGKQLRVHLTIEPPELAILPWEFLWDAQEDTYLAISSETALVRYVPIHVPVHLTTTNLPLRILVVVANPTNLQPLNVQREQAIIQEALAESIGQRRVNLQFLERATVAEIGQAMRVFRPQVFHFVGHSSFTQEQGCIFLENDDRSARLVNERTFREFFVDCPDTCLVVLNACQSATISAHQPLVGMAPRLLQRQLTAVIAMQYPILDKTSLIFTREFYRTLAFGYPLEAAISEARRGIYLEVGGQTSEWGIPVLFLRAQDGRLFGVEPTEDAETKAKKLKQNVPINSNALGNYVNTNGGDFVEGNKIIQGDEVHGDKIDGAKIEAHIGQIESGAQVFIGDPHITQASPLEILPPPEPARPPEPAGFVGRQTELAYYRERLISTHWAIICGAVGVGKSALAAVLARDMVTPDKLFWYSFHGEEGYEPFLWQLAGFLARHGRGELWQVLQSVGQTGRQPLPPATLFSYLLQLIRGQGYLLCLDDFPFVDSDAHLTQLMEQLLSLLSSGGLSLLITAQRIPNLSKASGFETLEGLNIADTRNLLTTRELALSDSLLTDLYVKTAGNAELLTLAIDTLQRTTDPARLIAHLVESQNIERYLINEVDKGLSADQRTVMNAVAILQGDFGTRQVIETLIGTGSVLRAVHELSSHYLLLVRETEQGRAYGQHAILQAFYYDLLGQRERMDMHRRAATYFIHTEPNALKAARHAQFAGEFAQAAELAVQNLWAIVNLGEVQALRQLVEGFTAEQLNPWQWARVNLARGQIYTLLGEGELARKSFESVLDNKGAVEASELHQLRVYVYEGMGRLLEQESPQEALEWLQRGLQELVDASDLEKATLYIRLGSVQSAIGEFKDALHSLQCGLALLPETPSQLRASALTNIGNIYAAQGDIQEGSSYYHQALAISEQLHDDFQMMAIRSNLGIDKEITGDWQGALADYQEALTLAERLGSLVEQARLANSLGTIYTKLGDDTKAITHLERAIATARLHENREDWAYSLTSFADLKVRQGEIAAVETSLTEAEQLAQELDLESLLAEINCLWAQLYLHRSEPQRAIDYAERAVKSAHDLDLKVEEGKFLRTLGRAQAADSQVEQALTTMDQSLALLTDRDPYEAACTKMAWGQLLVMKGEVAQSQVLLHEAQAAFQKLAAKRELLAVDQLIHESN